MNSTPPGGLPKLKGMADPRKMPKPEVERMLRRAGLSHDLIQDLLKDLPDLVDLDRDAAVLGQHGITRTQLTDMMGGSP
jgi:hypothetical protein